MVRDPKTAGHSLETITLTIRNMQALFFEHLTVSVNEQTCVPLCLQLIIKPCYAREVDGFEYSDNNQNIFEKSGTEKRG